MQLERRIQEERAGLAKRAWKFVEQEGASADLSSVDPTALRTVLSAATHATCFDEIRIVLRYQTGRKILDGTLTEKLLKELGEAIKAARTAETMAENERDRGEALLAASFLGFVVQLHRYHHEKARAARPDDRTRAPRRGG